MSEQETVEKARVEILAILEKYGVDIKADVTYERLGAVVQIRPIVVMSLTKGEVKEAV